MLYRELSKKIDSFLSDDHREALLITGARQVGKTYLIRECAKKYFEHVIEINFIESPDAVKLLENAKDSKDILLRISAFTDIPMEKGKTIIFFDEVQECKEIVTAIKFLVEEGSYRYILSGSLLGVELKDIRSVPVGYMRIYELFPMDFAEFCLANHVSERVLTHLHDCFIKKTPIDSIIHEKMMALYRLYLVIGGMPAVVDTYLRTNNLQKVAAVQQGIVQLYKRDIAKYDPQHKLYLEEIFTLIPSELNAKNKRFILKKLNENFKFSRYEHSFIWLKEAGTALPVYCADEPMVPLLLSRSTNLFKLFLSDVGLLASMYMNGIQIKVLNDEVDINFGAIYENAVAQELKAHGYDLYYFNNRKQGELDFLIEDQGRVLPIEVKSGKSFERHPALTNVMKNERYHISEAIVFCNENIQEKDGITYYPIYLADMLRPVELDDDIYRLDIHELQI